MTSNPRNVRVRTTSEQRDRSRTNLRGREKTRSVFTEDTEITDLDTGEVTTMRSKSVSRNGEEKRASNKFKVSDAEGKTLMKENTRYKKGGKVKKFNTKYTKGSKNPGERKKLMKQISAIYDKHRGTKDKRKKKGFPPAVAKRLKELMKRRDKL